MKPKFKQFTAVALGALLIAGTAPAAAPMVDDYLDIPAFLRRQAD